MSEPKRLSDEEVAAIGARLAKATALPWTAFKDSDGGWWIRAANGADQYPIHHDINVRSNTPTGNDEADIQFCAHARTDIPRLLSDRAASSERIEALEKALAEGMTKMKRSIEIIDRDLYRQREKVEDVKFLLNVAIETAQAALAPTQEK